MYMYKTFDESLTDYLNATLTSAYSIEDTTPNYLHGKILKFLIHPFIASSFFLLRFKVIYSQTKR